MTGTHLWHVCALVVVALVAMPSTGAATGSLADASGRVDGAVHVGSRRRSKSLTYVFKAEKVDDGSVKPQLTFDPKRSLDTAVDAFKVFTALPHDNFWVNLNPNEQANIIENNFGNTTAGRVLLEADLRMKKTVGELVHPDSETGGQFWGEFYSHQNALSNMLCFSFRTWIVPGKVTVVDFQDVVYILEAKMDVKMESEYYRIKGVDHDEASGCPEQADPALQEMARELYQELILPQLIDRINTGEEYAQIREVFYARVLSEWYRGLNDGPAAESSDNGQKARIVPGGDESAGNLIADSYPRVEFDALAVFDAYVASLNSGEFKLIRKVAVEDRVYPRNFFYGGVDFTKIDVEYLSPEDVMTSGGMLLSASS
eukprot:GFYU01005920.1.p1 GENE.GFYU01005920.1~~GFYU01005920.1.p1  ORF type:complete len:372 (-),score=106.05 GFYU01005920.1:116-1231(-)